MIVTLKRPLNLYGYNWEAGKTVEVSMKFYRILVKGMYCDPHPDDAELMRKAKTKKAPAPQPELSEDVNNVNSEPENINE
jgi:hypothetical protein